jgi:hypothetical protein
VTGNFLKVQMAGGCATGADQCAASKTAERQLWGRQKPRKTGPVKGQKAPISLKNRPFPPVFATALCARQRKQVNQQNQQLKIIDEEE